MGDRTDPRGRWRSRSGEVLLSERVAIVGAGLAGLAAARLLQSRGATVTMFDKGRRPGGRASTREHGAYCFDHGAQYFTVRDPEIRGHLQDWLAAGVVTQWRGRLVRIRNGSVEPAKDGERYVAVPGMGGLAQHLAAGLDVHASVKIDQVLRHGDCWSLVDLDGTDRGHFSAVIVAVPAPQAVPLLAHAPSLATTVRGVDMASCWAGMFVFDESVDLAFDGAFITDGPLSWVARDSSKPGRPDAESWVAHASPDWSRAHARADRERVGEAILEALESRFGPLPALRFQRAHRWGYASGSGDVPEAYLLDAEARIGACGDWCAGGRVEGALMSGLRMGRRILEEGALLFNRRATRGPTTPPTSAP